MHLFNEYPASDPDHALFGRFGPGQRLNYGKVNDPKLTPLINAQRAEADPVKRRELIRQAVRYINENAVGIGIDRPVTTIFWHSYVKNFGPHFDWGQGTRSVNLWLDK